MSRSRDSPVDSGPQGPRMRSRNWCCRRPRTGGLPAPQLQSAFHSHRVLGRERRTGLGGNLGDLGSKASPADLKAGVSYSRGRAGGAAADLEASGVTFRRSQNWLPESPIPAEHHHRARLRSGTVTRDVRLLDASGRGTKNGGASLKTEPSATPHRRSKTSQRRSPAYHMQARTACDSLTPTFFNLNSQTSQVPMGTGSCMCAKPHPSSIFGPGTVRRTV